MGGGRVSTGLVLERLVEQGGERTHRQMMLKMMIREKLKMFAMPSAKQRITQIMPTL